MAVIREQRQFEIGPIGVARASEGGRVVGQAISQSANQLADVFYREGLQVAERTGVETAQSVERERIMTINPETGQPEAYTPPAPLGRAASEAYQRVVERRFQDSIDEEMRIRSAELAARYQDNPNSTALYESAMSDYIAAMSNNAEGQFQTYISDVGTSYLNLTRSNLAISQMRRERAAAREAQASAAQSANNNLESLVAQYGPEILNGPTIAASIAQSSTETISDGVEAGLFNPSAFDANNRDQRDAVARGAIRNAANNIQDPETLELLQHAIGTQNAEAVPAGLEPIAEIMRSYGSDFSGLAELERFSDGLLSDRREYVGVLRQREVANMEREDAISIFNITQGTPAAISSASSMASNPVYTAGGVAEHALRTYTRMTEEAAGYIAEGRTDLSGSVISNRDSVLDGYVRGLHLRVVQDLTRDQTNQLEAAIMAENPRLAPTAESREALSALINISRNTDYDVVSDLPPFVGAYRDSAASFVDAQNAAAAYSDFQQNVEGDIYSIRLQRGENIDAALAGTLGQINSIENLEPSVAEDAQNEARFRAGQAFISQFFEGRPTETQISAAATIIEGGNITDGLTQNQADILSAARDLGALSNRESNLRTHFNSMGRRVNELRTQEEARIQEGMDVNRIFNQGAGNPRSESDRQIVESSFTRAFSEQLQAAGYETLGQMFVDPQALLSPDARPILEAVNQMNVMPESLHNLFRSLASGAFVGNSPATLISHYTNFRDYTYNGVVMENPMMASLSEEHRATLNFIADAAPIIGTDNQSFAELFSARSRMQSDPNFSSRAEAFFGSTPYEFIRNLDGYNNLPVTSIRGMEAAALSMFSLASERGMDADYVRTQLERQIDRTYPDGGGIVFAPDMSRRTRAPLSYAAPNNEDLFQDYVIQRMSEGGVSNASLGIVNRGALAVTSRAIAGPIFGSTASTPTNDYFLQPLGVPTPELVQYQVMELLPPELGGRRSVMETVEETDIEGTTVSVTRPLIVTNQDRRYLSMVEERTLLENSNYIQQAERVGRVREEYAPAPEFEFGFAP